ncbi:MAG: alpha/beta fold hydrolase [Gemmatimonadetes bacterium]|nr:alpha/beta fold hydrolase [Gemmatimonadota bacterium]
MRVPGSTLFYESAGTGSPVILLHGGNLDRRMWDAEFGALQRTHRVIRYDARGYGRSGASDTAFSAHHDLRALMDALQLPRASLVGLSLGGVSRWTSHSRIPSEWIASCWSRRASAAGRGPRTPIPRGSRSHARQRSGKTRSRWRGRGSAAPTFALRCATPPPQSACGSGSRISPRSGPAWFAIRTSRWKPRPLRPVVSPSLPPPSCWWWARPTPRSFSTSRGPSRRKRPACSVSTSLESGTW